MKTKQVLSIAMILVWQAETLASTGLMCKHFFADAPKVATEKTEPLLKEIREVEALEQALNKKTETLLATAVFETANQSARALEMSIKFNLWQKSVSTVQEARVKMQEAYNLLKEYEPRVLALRHAEQVGLISNAEKAELVTLETQRKQHLSYIGIHLPAYKRIMHVLEREIREGKAAEKQLSAQAKAEADAARVNLETMALKAPEPAPETMTTPDSLSPESQHMQGQLAEFVLRNTSLKNKYSSLENAKSIVDPTVEQLHAIAFGRDKNMAEGEKMLPRKAKAEHDLKLQEATEKEIKNIERILDNEAAFATFVDRLMKVAPTHWAKTLGESVRAFRDAASPKETQVNPLQINGLNEVRNALRDTKSLLAHYSGISKLMDVYLTPQQRYALLRELCSHFNPPVDGVPPFMITLARRSDAFDILAEIKAYVKANHPNEIMGKTTTMVDIISKAETYREYGLLPSIFNPKDVVVKQMKKAVKTATVTTFSGVLLAVIYQYFMKDDEKKATPAPTPAGP